MTQETTFGELKSCKWSLDQFEKRQITRCRLGFQKVIPDKVKQQVEARWLLLRTSLEKILRSAFVLWSLVCKGESVLWFKTPWRTPLSHFQSNLNHSAWRDNWQACRKILWGSKEAGALKKKMLGNDNLLSLIASYIQAKRIGTVASQRKVGTFGMKSRANCTSMDAAVAAETNIVQNPAFMSSKSSSEYRNQSHKPLRAHHDTPSYKRQNKCDKSSK